MRARMKNPHKVSSVVLLGIVLSAASYAAVRPAHADEQPRMKSALDALEVAKWHLENATTDKGGHRLKAKQLTKEAIDETKKGIEFDDKQH